MAVFTVGIVNKEPKIEIQVSPLFEMMACLRYCHLNKGGKQEDLKKFYNNHQKLLFKFYGNFEYGAQLAECILGLKNEEHTFENLMKYLKSVKREEFLYYLLGRYLSINEIKKILDNEKSPSDIIQQKIRNLKGNINKEQLDFVKNYEDEFSDLFKLWNNFYKNVFRDMELDLESKWIQSNNLLMKDLLESDLNQLISKLLYGNQMPKQFPDSDIKLIRFIPSFFVTPRFITIWGFGELNIVYDMSLYLNKKNITYNQKKDEEKSLKQMSEIGKSLSELGRLKILSLISSKPKIKSQEIAQRMGITTATVSRHLSILKNNNLIIERKENGYNIYNVNIDEFEKYFNNIRRKILK